MNQPGKVAVTLVLSLALGGTIISLSRIPSPWDSWRPATCMPDHCFCEQIRPGLVRQPANAVSGVAFISIAFLMMLLTCGSSRPDPGNTRSFASQRIYPALYTFAAAMVGVGTTFYHASLTFWGQSADILGMYLIATFVVLYAASRIASLKPPTIAAAYIVGNALLITAAVAWPQVRRYVFAMLVVTAVIMEALARRREGITAYRQFNIAAAALFGGFVLWVVDIIGIACAPQSWLQGHALWHIAGATAVWSLFSYYRTAVH